MKSLNVPNDAILSLNRLFTQALELTGLLEPILEVDANTSLLTRIGTRSLDTNPNGIRVYGA